MEYIDLRSDTVTQPTPAMREAMAAAEVGDDVYGEDPTVNHLQEIAAAMLGKEAALFVASGTMGNLVAVLSHCQRGEEVIVGNRTHIFLNEAGGISALGGIHSHQLPNLDDGSLEIERIRSAIRSDDPHEPISRLVCLENTHNRCGGTYQSVEYTNSVCELAHEKGLKVHLDGARIFNAAIAQHVQARDLAAQVDSITFCLSKGLCAPVGSILCGSGDFIRKAARLRKMVGGGMRQAGIIAAAGVVALESMLDRLETDHRRTAVLAYGLGLLPQVVLQAAPSKTNMLFLTLAKEVAISAHEFYGQMKARGILVDEVGDGSLRLVLHNGIEDHDITLTIQAFRDILQ